MRILLALAAAYAAVIAWHVQALRRAAWQQDRIEGGA